MHTYDGVGEVVDAFLVSDERAVDGVDDERCPADDEHDDDEYQRHGDVPLLLVDLVFVHRRAVSQVAAVRADLSQHADYHTGGTRSVGQSNRARQ